MESVDDGVGDPAVGRLVKGTGVRVVLDVHREGSQYVGTLTRVDDQLQVPFWGLLELVYALEQAESTKTTTPEGSPSEND